MVHTSVGDARIYTFTPLATTQIYCAGSGETPQPEPHAADVSSLFQQQQHMKELESPQ